MFSAVLDTCVLFPSGQRDFLLQAAENGLYRPLWSRKIEEELDRSLRLYRENKGIDKEVTDAYIVRLLHQMNVSFPDARVEHIQGTELSSRNKLPDLNDEHVMMAALIGRADVIVTNNLKDFPLTILSPYNIDVLSPDEFLTDLFDLSPTVMGNTLKVISERTGKKGPSFTSEEVLQRLEKSCPNFVNAFHNNMDV